MLHRIKRIKDSLFLSKQIKIPKIPKAFIDNSQISQTLCLTINEFSFEEQTVIYLYYLVKLSVEEIANLTELSTLHIESTLVLYSKKLTFKLGVYKKAVPYNDTDLLTIGEMLELERGIV